MDRLRPAGRAVAQVPQRLGPRGRNPDHPRSIGGPSARGGNRNRGRGQLSDLTRYFAPFGTLTYTAPTLPSIAGFVDLGSTGGIPRFQIDGPIPAEYNGMVQAVFSGGLTSGEYNQAFVTTMPGYRQTTGTSTSYSLAIPDLSGAGFPSGAALGTPLSSYRIMMFGSTVSTALSNGAADLFSQHVVTIP